jgi:hypothetical protein
VRALYAGKSVNRRIREQEVRGAILERRKPIGSSDLLLSYLL